MTKNTPLNMMTGVWWDFVEGLMPETKPESHNSNSQVSFLVTFGSKVNCILDCLWLVSIHFPKPKYWKSLHKCNLQHLWKVPHNSRILSADATLSNLLNFLHIKSINFLMLLRPIFKHKLKLLALLHLQKSSCCFTICQIGTILCFWNNFILLE